MAETKFSSSEEAYNNYYEAPDRIYNGMLRESGQSFSDAMCEGSIVVGLDNAEEILTMIRGASN